MRNIIFCVMKFQVGDVSVDVGDGGVSVDDATVSVDGATVVLLGRVGVCIGCVMVTVDVCVLCVVHVSYKILIICCIHGLVSVSQIWPPPEYPCIL